MPATYAKKLITNNASKDVWCVTSDAVPDCYWLGHSLHNALGKSVGIDNISTSDSSLRAQHISVSSEHYKLFSAYLNSVEFMLDKDISGEYDTLPLCETTLNYLIDTLNHWLACIIFPFVGVGKQLATSVQQTIIQLELIQCQLISVD